MIYSFRVKNFLSFRDIQEISFVNQKESIKTLDTRDSVSINTVYGSNGAGKTNLVLAIAFVIKKLNPSSGVYVNNNEKKKIEKEFWCRVRGNNNKVSYFEFKIKTGRLMYSYGFEYNSEKNIVVSEWLTNLGDNKSIFLRFGNDLMINERPVDIGHFDEDSLLLGKLYYMILSDDQMVDQMDAIGITLFYYSYLSQIKVISYDSISAINGCVLLGCDSSFLLTLGDILGRVSDVEKVKKKKINEKCFDLDTAICIQNGVPFFINKSGTYELFFKQRGHREFVKFIELSSGVRRIIQLLLIFLCDNHSNKMINDQRSAIASINDRLGNKEYSDPIKDCTLYVVDEMCFALHPIISERLIVEINNVIKRQNLSIQTLYTMHETELMCGHIDANINFVDKKDGVSQIYSLSSFNSSVGDLKNMYLEGRLGATPEFKKFVVKNDN